MPRSPTRKAVATDFLAAIDRSLETARQVRNWTAHCPLRLCAAWTRERSDPGRQLSAHLWSGDDERVKATLEFLLDRCMFKGTFFQDMIHSGMNAYLTLHMAQCLLRADDRVSSSSSWTRRP